MKSIAQTEILSKYNVNNHLLQVKTNNKMNCNKKEHTSVKRFACSISDQSLNQTSIQIFIACHDNALIQNTPIVHKPQDFKYNK